MPTTYDPKIINLVKAIAMQEGGGTPDYTSGIPGGNPAGADGERGAYQWLPGNFESAAKQYGLDPTDFSPTNQNRVAYAQIADQIKQGKKPQEVASWWNSGDYNSWQPGTVQKNGNTPAYVQGVSKYYKQFNGQTPAAPTTVTPPPPTGNRFLPLATIATMAANAKAGKNPVVDFVTGSEQQFGKAMTGAITGQSQVADAQKVTAGEQNYIKTLVDERAKIQASGGDTSRLDGMIANAQKNTSATYQQPDIPTEASTVEGALGTAADILTMGTYGAASEGAKFGELMAKESEPLAVSAGKKVLDKTGKLIIGSDAAKTLEQIANPEAKAFIPKELGGAGKTFEDVVKGTSDAIDSFVAKSKAALQAVKQAIPNNIYVDTEKIGTTVNDAIMKSVKSSADYKGIAGDAETLFKTPKDLVDSGLLDSNEASKVKGMVDAINNWKDTSARGILN